MRYDIESLNRKAVEELISQVTESPESALPLAAEWIDSFFELLHVSDTEDPQFAYDLIAAWARLWRADPGALSTAADVHIPDDRSIGGDLWSDLFGASRYRRYEECLSRRLPELTRLAILVPDPFGWMDELEDFSEAVFEGADVGTVGWAIDLIEDLDTAELVYWAAKRYLRDAAETRQLGLRLRAARAALYRHRESFVVCRTFIISFARAVDYDPPDPELRHTLTKVPMLLEELVRCRRVIRGEDVSEAAARAAHLLAQGAVQERLLTLIRRSVLNILRFTQPQPMALAADVPAEGQPNPLSLVRWVSPDGRYVARIDLPEEITAPRSSVPVSICRAIPVGDRHVPGPEATELAGRRVRLAGIERTISPSGRFEISIEQFSEVVNEGRALMLELWENGTWVEWSVVDVGS